MILNEFNAISEKAGACFSLLMSFRTQWIVNRRSVAGACWSWRLDFFLTVRRKIASRSLSAITESHSKSIAMFRRSLVKKHLRDMAESLIAWGPLASVHNNKKNVNRAQLECVSVEICLAHKSRSERWWGDCRAIKTLARKSAERRRSVRPDEVGEKRAGDLLARR